MHWLDRTEILHILIKVTKGLIGDVVSGVIPMVKSIGVVVSIGVVSVAGERHCRKKRGRQRRDNWVVGRTPANESLLISSCPDPHTSSQDQSAIMPLSHHLAT